MIIVAMQLAHAYDVTTQLVCSLQILQYIFKGLLPVRENERGCCVLLCTNSAPPQVISRALTDQLTNAPKTLPL